MLKRALHLAMSSFQSKCIYTALAVFIVCSAGLLPSKAFADYTISTPSFPSGAGNDGGYVTGGAGNYNHVGQQIQTSAAGTISTVTAAVAFSAGTPTDGIVAELYTDSSGSIGSLLGTSTVVPASSIPTSPAGTGVTFTFSSPVTVSASTYYWIVIDRYPYSHNISSYYEVDGASSGASTWSWYSYPGADQYLTDGSSLNVSADVVTSGGGGGGPPPDEVNINSFYHGTTTLDTILTPSGHTFTIANAYSIGLVSSFSDDTYYVSENNTGYAAGSTDLDTDSALLARNIDGTYVIWSTGGSEGYCFFTYTLGVVNLTDCGAPTFLYNPLVTGIIAVTPTDGSTIATSTSATIGATVNVTANDYQAGDYVTIQLSYDATSIICGGSVANLNACVRTFTFPLTGAGLFTLSTSTSLLGTGDVTTITTINRKSGLLYDILSVFDIQNLDTGNIVDSVTAHWTVASTSPIDEFIKTGNLLAVSGLASTTNLEFYTPPYCVIGLSFSLTECGAFWLLPSSITLSGPINDLMNTILSRAPFGYVNRLITIFTDGATTSIPAFTYTAGSSSPAVLQAAGPLTINIFSYFGEVTAIKADDGSNKDIWDIIDPYFDVLVSFSVLFVILSDLIGIEFGEGNSLTGDFSDRQKYQIEGMKQQSRTEYPFGRGRVGYDRNGKNIK